MFDPMKKRNYWHLVGFTGMMTAAISFIVWANKDREQRKYVSRRSAGA